MKESLLYFGEDRNNVAIFIGKIRLQTLIDRHFFATARGFETHQVYYSNKHTLYYPSHAQQTFSTQIQGGYVTIHNQGLSPDDKGGIGEITWERGIQF